LGVSACKSLAVSKQKPLRLKVAHNVVAVLDICSISLAYSFIDAARELFGPVFAELSFFCSFLVLPVLV